ncbi:hypothetical protein BASA50_010458 [Batrachochytrium salamandrivorans]|uniref:Protein kinase domain-containing protein n=1 Tax=Batrachochytrium salamandrivorans TaxID=1357716 RepID=A0ABQ8EYF4_9FUNG|nr:hypothetical protein BASA50_010458 [Batrachochytrium salamandrivorans]
MISLYGLFILLLTAEAIHAQGNTNEGDDVDHASDSKDATSLPLESSLLRLPTALQESNTPDQRSTSAPADLQPGKECQGGHGIRKVFSPCPQQPSQPEPLPSTSYDPHQSNEMPLPIRIKKAKEIFTVEARKLTSTMRFTEEESQVFGIRIPLERLLGQGDYGIVSLATRTSNGVKVAYKSVEKSNVDGYTLETNPPPRCHLSNPLVGSEEKSAAQCMSSRPPKLMIPYESMVQMYLSRPGRHNPYVPEVTDYIVLEDRYITVMEYVGEGWATLSSYINDNGRPDIVDAREIIKEIYGCRYYF